MMSAAVVITRLALADHNGVTLTAFVIARFAVSPAVVIAGFAFTSTATVVAPESQVAVVRSISTCHIVHSSAARECASADALMEGPIAYASAGPAHPHSRVTPVVGLSGAAGEQRESSSNQRHDRMFQQLLLCFHEATLRTLKQGCESGKVTRL